MAVSITDAAAQHIQRQIKSRKRGIGVRLGIKTAGCSGIKYVFEFIDSQENQSETDSMFEYLGAKLFVDNKSLIYIDGSVLDYVKEGLNEGFKLNNPNVKSECGCGESFNI